MLVPGGIFDTQSKDKCMRWGQTHEMETIGQDHTAKYCCVLAMAKDEETWAQELPSLLLVVTQFPAGPLVSGEVDLGQGPWSPTVSQGWTWMMGLYRSDECCSVASYLSVVKNIKGLVRLGMYIF